MILVKKNRILERIHLDLQAIQKVHLTNRLLLQYAYSVLQDVSQTIFQINYLDTPTCFTCIGHAHVHFPYMCMSYLTNSYEWYVSCLFLEVSFLDRSGRVVTLSETMQWNFDKVRAITISILKLAGRVERIFFIVVNFQYIYFFDDFNIFSGLFKNCILLKRNRNSRKSN